jgi:hypothetical protein
MTGFAGKPIPEVIPPSADPVLEHQALATGSTRKPVEEAFAPKALEDQRHFNPGQPRLLSGSLAKFSC